MNPIAALLFFVTIVNLFLGGLVFFRNRKNHLYISLSRFIFLVAAWMFCMGAFYQVRSIDYAFWWIRWTYVFGIVIANTLIYFALVFPKGLAFSLKQSFLLYAPALPLIAAILFVPEFLFKEIITHSWWKDVKLGVFEYTIYTIYFIVVYFGAITILFKKYFSYSGKLKLQVTYVLSAVFIAGSFGAIFDLLFPWINFYKYIWLGPIGTLIMVGIFIYVIVKHRFLDIRLIVARAVTYSLLVFILGAIYALGLFGIGTLLIGVTSGTSQMVISMILALIMAFTFQPLKRQLEKFTDSIFYKGHYDPDLLMSHIGSVMSTNIELQSLTAQIIRVLLDEMRISKGAFVILGEEQGTIYEIIDLGFPQKLTVLYSQISMFLPFPQIIVFDELEESSLKNLMRQMDISVVKTLKVENEVVGLLLLGGKASGEIYSDQDLKVLEILASEMGVALQNSKSYDKIKKFNVILSDEIRKATTDLQGANARLKTIDKLKDDFVSIASHELRTPMTAIRSYAWMALNRPDVPLSKNLEKYIARILISTERLINLVNDMLNVSRIESGKIEINPEAIDLVSLAKDIIDELYFSKSEEKSIQFKVLEKPIPKVFADPEKLRQVFLNLVGNSLKFTPSGGKITFDFFTDGKVVETSVSDSGVGISKEDINKLFNKFSRLDNSYTAAATSGGTGLGLYISKNLVELMHGKIWVNSEGLNKGATFTVSLPVASQEVLKDPAKYIVKAHGIAKGLESVSI